MAAQAVMWRGAALAALAGCVCMILPGLRLQPPDAVEQAQRPDGPAYDAAEDLSLLQLGTARREGESRSWVSARVADSLRLHDQLSQSSADLPDGPTKDLMHSFKICTGCDRFERWGEDGDGGYLQCREDLSRGQVLAAYSLGVKDIDKWSADAHSKLGVPVHQFDCTVAVPAQLCPDCHFHQFCLCEGGGCSNRAFHGKTMNLTGMLEATGQGDAPDRSLIMKMDIEGSEWAILATTPRPVLRKFRQLSVEFHTLRREWLHAEYLKAMRALLAAGFRVAHAHSNNCCPMYRKGGYIMPEELEVTFTTPEDGTAECEDPRKLDLDMPNLPKGDQPAPHLP